MQKTRYLMLKNFICHPRVMGEACFRAVSLHIHISLDIIISKGWVLSAPGADIGFFCGGLCKLDVNFMKSNCY